MYVHTWHTRHTWYTLYAARGTRGTRSTRGSPPLSRFLPQSLALSIHDIWGRASFFWEEKQQHTKTNVWSLFEQ